MKPKEKLTAITVGFDGVAMQSRARAAVHSGATVKGHRRCRPVSADAHTIIAQRALIGIGERTLGRKRHIADDAACIKRSVANIRHA
jgi:hypothetical protein